MATPTNESGNLVEEFEEAFQQCMNVLTKDEGLSNNSIGSSLAVDKDEARMEVEQVTLKFIDVARQMEAFFLQKRFILSALKPELAVKEDVIDLKFELTRKEDLIKRHYDKIALWQNLLADLQGWAKSPAQGPAPNGLANGNPPPQGQPGPNGAGGPQMAPQPPQTPQMLQHQHQLQQQQLQMQHSQMQQQQMHQQVQQTGAPVPPGLQGVNVAQQGMFMGQSGVAGRGGFPVGGVGVGSSALQGPLAFLEKTTSNIGMPEGRS